MLFIIITIKFISTEGALGLPMRDMEFVKTFKPPDFQAKNLTPSISPNFNSFSDKTTNKMSENGEIYTAGQKFYTANRSAQLWVSQVPVTGTYLFSAHALPARNKPFNVQLHRNR